MLNSTLVSAVTESPLAITVNWDEIFATHNKKLLNFIRKRITSHEDADDILQMTCLEVLCNRHKFRGASRPETWVFGIAVNLIRNYYRSKQVHYLFDNLDDETTPDLLQDNDPSDLAENRQLLSHTLASLETLSVDVRVMLSMLVEEEGSYQDIAQQLNIPVGTVRSRLSRARETLKGRIYA